jgi:TRAP-type transport system periplasmic protein
MARILISYRRADSQAIAGRIFDRLIAHYGEDSVFMDIDAIPFGIDFRKHIADALAQCSVLVELVGPRWLGSRDGGGNRIGDPADPVRLELEGAFELGIPIIPVLIDGATMPSEADLPPSLKQFSFLNAAPVDSGRDFRTHMDRLLRSIDNVLGSQGERAVAVSRGRPPGNERARSVKPWYALAAVVLVVAAGAVLAILQIRSHLQEIAASPPAGSPPQLPPPSSRQESVALKSADDFLVRKYANDIKSANVNLTVELDSAAFAAGIAQQWDAMVKGELDLASFYLDSVADKVPAFAATLMPGLIRNREHAGRVNASAFMAQIKRLAAGAGVIVLSDAWQSLAVFSKKTCIRAPEDVKGLKISTYAAGDGFTSLLKAAGAASVDIVQGEVTAALRSGADALVASPVTGRGKIELASCATVPGEYTLGFGYLPLLGSKVTFGRLNANQQNVVLKVAKALETANADGLKQMDDYIVAMLGTSGMQTVALSQGNYEAWLKVAQASTYREFASDVPDGGQLLDAALAVK